MSREGKEVKQVGTWRCYYDACMFNTSKIRSVRL